MSGAAQIRLAPPTHTVNGESYDTRCGAQYIDCLKATWEVTGVTNALGQPILAMVSASTVETLDHLVSQGRIVHMVGESAPATVEFEGVTYRTDRVYTDAVGDPWAHDGTWQENSTGPLPRFTRPDEPEYALTIQEVIRFHGPLTQAAA